MNLMGHMFTIIAIHVAQKRARDRGDPHFLLHFCNAHNIVMNWTKS